MNELTELLRQNVQRATQGLLALNDPNYLGQLERAALMLARALRAGGKVLIFGNGGSAADAQHIAAELMGRFERERPALAAVALTVDSSMLTAWSNDYAFDSVFARQIEGLGRPGDVAWGLSTSGNSANVVAAMQRARELGLRTLAFCGGSGGKLAAMVECAVVAPMVATARIQEAHLISYHALCHVLDAVFAAPASLTLD